MQISRQYSFWIIHQAHTDHTQVRLNLKKEARVRCFASRNRLIQTAFSQKKSVQDTEFEMFCFSDNAIPIKSWFNDPSDTALLNLLPVLDALRFVSDVRSVLSRNREAHRLW